MAYQLFLVNLSKYSIEDEQVLEVAPHGAAGLRPRTSHHKTPSKLDEPDMQVTAGEAGRNS